MGKSESKKRPARPAAERAQEALDTADRVVARIKGRLDAAKQTVKELEAELTSAQKRRDYAAQNPDLPEQPTAPVEQSADPRA